MRVLYERCCGMDIHQASIVACVLSTVKGKPVEETRRFGTMTEDLEALSKWLKEREVQQVAMESTGVYWKPVWNILEPAGFDLLLANAQEVKNVPGRKTDQKDSQWIADLQRHGMLRKSFVPPREIRELRDLTRTRATLTQDHSSICNRIQKVLEDGNIKLACVASDVFGASGRAMLKALMNGESDAQVLAELSKGRLRAKLKQLQRALDGRVTAHHRFLLHQHWEELKLLEDQICGFDQEIARRMHATAKELGPVESSGSGTPLAMSPRDEAISLWMEIPGVGRTAASVLVAELGVNMEQFPSSGDMASWAALCPGNNESAGKRKSGKTRKGTCGYGARCRKWRGPHHTPRILTLPHNSAALRRGGVRSGH